MLDLIGEDNIMVELDFPHFDTEPPFTAPMLKRSDMTQAQLDGVMRRAALAFYGLDWERIVAANNKRRRRHSVGDPVVSS